MVGSTGKKRTRRDYATPIELHYKLARLSTRLLPPPVLLVFSEGRAPLFHFTQGTSFNQPRAFFVDNRGGESTGRA